MRINREIFRYRNMANDELLATMAQTGSAISETTSEIKRLTHKRQIDKDDYELQRYEFESRIENGDIDLASVNGPEPRVRLAEV